MPKSNASSSVAIPSPSSLSHFPTSFIPNFGEAGKLDGTNYPIWKVKIRSHLVARRLWNLTTGVEEKPADEKDSKREQCEQWMKENNIKGEHIFVTHEEWKFLSAKFQFAATPFSTAVDKKGKLTTQKVLDKKYN